MTNLLRWFPALVWMSIIFYWSSQPVLPIDSLPNSSLAHYLSHIGAYGILAVLLTFGTGSSRRGLWLAFVLVILYGVSDEIHQSFTPGRKAGVKDVAVNTLAAGTALLLLSRLRPWERVPLFRRVYRV